MELGRTHGWAWSSDSGRVSGAARARYADEVRSGVGRVRVGRDVSLYVQARYCLSRLALQQECRSAS